MPATHVVAPFVAPISSRLYLECGNWTPLSQRFVAAGLQPGHATRRWVGLGARLRAWQGRP